MAPLQRYSRLVFFPCLDNYRALVWTASDGQPVGTFRELDRRFPSVAAMEKAAARRIPRFAHDYLVGGIGGEKGVRRNRDDLDAVKLMPRYLVDANQVALGCELLGRGYDAPFGIAPIGLNGLIWPGAAQILARAARRHNLPFALSTFATASIEDIAPLAGESGWFQLYLPNDPAIEDDLIERAAKAGYPVLVLTVDIPVSTRRERDIKNGLSVPPRFTLKTLAQIAARPVWAWNTLKAGIPQFRSLQKHFPEKVSFEDLSHFLYDLTAGHVTPDRLKRVREQWPGKLLIKGLLDPAEVALCRDLGADGVIVSNHGGRQLDAAPSPVEMLPVLRRVVGPGFPLLADSGARSGLDIARLLALGADFVLLGRAPMLALGAMGARGGDHVLALLKEELAMTMSQIGCITLDRLPEFLHGRVDSAQEEFGA